VVVAGSGIHELRNTAVQLQIDDCLIQGSQLRLGTLGLDLLISSEHRKEVVQRGRNVGISRELFCLGTCRRI
jgi:hypothetical protein